MDSNRSREFLEWPFQLLQFPDITYEADSDELHTVLIADLDIYQPGSPIKNYIHFMATNVPGEKLHRHSSLHSHFRPKFGHEKEVLGTQKSLAAGRNGQVFDARYLLDF